MKDKYLDIEITMRFNPFDGPVYVVQYYWPHIKEIIFYWKRDGIDATWAETENRCVAIWRLKTLKTA